MTHAAEMLALALLALYGGFGIDVAWKAWAVALVLLVIHGGLLGIGVVVLDALIAALRRVWA